MTGTLASRADALDQPLAAARDDHVHELGHRDQVADGGAVGGVDQLHGVGGRPASSSARAPARPAPGWTGCLGAAAQDAGVAALDGQRRGLDGHVGPALIDHAEHAQRHAHVADADAGGAALHAGDLADRVGHGGDLLAALGHGLQHLGAEAQAVDHRRARPAAARHPGRLALAVECRAGLARRRRASASSAAFLAAVGAAAMAVAARRALAPTLSI
jgi:hypothetical protein